ncbi:Spt20 family-domain-containing protein [Vararia minispora EC-137]|uniref:Spt20 family-domain-containing protein n=1 Tax=Vararia minispora EC-137 TaxID=1314806 RepID=A0ACB8Q6C9_9AGAM|nr:Spt20 family-domain-containing protein [Vararia minispora EC-137]
MTYNVTRENRELLEKHRHDPASLSVQLYHDHWTLNSGSKFLYNSPSAALLEEIRAYRMPVDLLELLDQANVPFYDGCMIVELQDFREPRAVKDKKAAEEAKSGVADIMRVVLRPNPETLWADLRILNQKNGDKWTDQKALELEAKILLATAPPLCLHPDPHIGRMANSILRVSMPRTPPPLRPRKRKLESTEADELARARKAKILQFMNPQRNRSATPRCVVIPIRPIIGLTIWL